IFLRQGGGFFSRFLVEIGTTVCIVMVASLVVALTVVPMAASLVLRRERPGRPGILGSIGDVYERVLRGTLRFRLPFLLLAVGLLWGSWYLFGTIERSFAGRTQERQVTVNIDTPRNYGVEQTRDLFEQVRAVLLAHKQELDIADVTSSFFVGSGRARGRGRQRSFELYLKDESESQLSTGDVRDRIRELLPAFPGVELRIGASRRRGGGNGGVEVELAGEDPAVLELLGREVAEKLAAIPGASDVDLSLESGDEQLLVRVDRPRAVQAGLTSQAVARTVQGALSERALAFLAADDQEVEVVMLQRTADRGTLGELRNLSVFGDDGAVPLDALAELEAVPGPRAIERQNRMAKVKITTNADSPRSMGRVMAGAGGIMAGLALPPGYSWSFGRFNRRAQQDQAGADFALLFALLLVYMLMAALFESFGQPLSIMAAVPFAFLGVGVVMKLASQPRDNFTELGFLVLVGVVVNNAIVLVDHVNRLRQGGLGRAEAIVQGGRDRLRAILMTAVTTMFGLAPMVAPVIFPETFGPLEGRAATWAPVGLVILGGLTTSTFLTLLIVPTFYSVVDDVGRFFRRLSARVLSQRAARDAARGA
ncbi:MAG: efflux RND transporter permease subunit, partial [Acidobacteriota bacterium]